MEGKIFNRRSSAKKHRWFETPLVLLIGLILVGVGYAQQDLPQNPIKGRFIFEEKGCGACHGGESIGPDLSEIEYYGTSLELASVMWNHLPKMLLQIHEQGMTYPNFTEEEFNDLLTYIFYLRYLGTPGNISDGKAAFGSKGCNNCHSIAGYGKRNGYALDELGKYVSSLFLAQALWNHGPEMEDEMALLNIERPHFENDDLVDLHAYIRSEGKESSAMRVFQSPGNPNNGYLIFNDKGCLACHAINGEGTEIGPDLDAMDWDKSVGEISGTLLNHSSEMNDLILEKGLKRPSFTSSELADVTAYLYFFGFSDTAGDSQAGLKAFKNKGCVNCHSINNDLEVDKIRRSLNLETSIAMAQIMWNHAPIMEKKASEKVLAWPELSGADMVNIYSYLLTITGQ